MELMTRSPVASSLLARSAFAANRFIPLGATCLALATAALAAQKVSGRVTNDGGTPRAAAQVRFEPGGKIATTNPDGAFTINDLPDGRYTVTVQSEGASQSFDATVKGGHLSPETLKLQKPAEQRVSGRVVDRDRKGLEGLKVSIAARQGEPVLTDSEGRFFLTILPGTYKITVTADGKTQKFDVTVADGRMTPSELTF
jgi:Carboxypeptidase regulatory-like domain